jgi:hypothetical protein
MEGTAEVKNSQTAEMAHGIDLVAEVFVSSIYILWKAMGDKWLCSDN